VFAASWCYAKITPAALQRGKFRRHCRERAEAAGANPKFRSSKSPRVAAGWALPVVRPRWLASS